MTTTTDAIFARDIHKSFGPTRVLKGVSLHLREGEIRCLAGENGCGKSTLIKIISGTLSADSGSVELGGQSADSLSARARIGRGLSVIYQDFALFPNLSVAENITLLKTTTEGSRPPSSAAMRRAAQETLAGMGVDLPLDALVEEIPVASKQLTAIARALHAGSRIIIMDEPTTALTHREVEQLFGLVRKLRDGGVSFLFVSHKLEEVFEICDSITVLRSGEVVAEGPLSDFTPAQVRDAIVGREIRDEQLQPPLAADAPVLLDIQNLSRAPQFQNVSLSVRAGEIVGIAGLLGSGRTELALSLAGLNPAQSGTVKLGGQDVTRKGLRELEGLGIAYVPEDRLSEGLFLEHPIQDNMVIASLGQTVRGTWLDPRSVAATGRRLVDALAIRTPDPANAVSTLSGGNQQRVVIARYLELKPKVLILNGPSVGVDVGSKSEIHQLIARLAAEGTATLVISDDLRELTAICHRIFVMEGGTLKAEHDGRTVQESVLAAEIAGERVA